MKLKFFLSIIAIILCFACTPKNQSRYFSLVGKLQYAFEPTGFVHYGYAPGGFLPLPNNTILCINGLVKGSHEGGLEIYDPQKRQSFSLTRMPFRFRDTELLGYARYTYLPNNKVLMTGDFGCLEENPNYVFCKNTTGLIYDIELDKFLPLKGFDPIRTGHTLTSLSDGKVLIIGGRQLKNYYRSDGQVNALTSVLLFDSKSMNFHEVGHIQHERIGHSTLRLNEHQFLLIGGERHRFYNEKGTKDVLVDNIEIFDLHTGESVVIGKLKSPRKFPELKRTSENNILITGGKSTGNAILFENDSTLEIFNLSTKSSQIISRDFPTLLGTIPIKLKEGLILLIGTEGVFTFNLENDSLKLVDKLNFQREKHSIVQTLNGEIFVLGGECKNCSQVEHFNFNKFKKSRPRNTF